MSKDAAYFGGYFVVRWIMATGASVFSFEPAADRLIARGLRADKTELIRRLEMVGEFRLTDYAQFFRAENLYRGDATLEALWGIVEFDNRLRSLCFEAIGCIEVQVRSDLAYRFAHEYGPYEYLDATNFPNFSRQGPTFTWWLGKIKEAQENLARDHTGSAPASNVTIPGSEPELPIWTIAENIDFGTTLSFFQGVADNIQKDVASALGQPDAIANSWLFGLRVLRNRCAHHDRIWNWRFDRTRVKIPQRRKFPEWHSPKLSNNQLGILLTICRYWLNHIYSGNDWTKRVLDLFDSHSMVQTSAMGLPTEWRKHPLWND